MDGEDGFITSLYRRESRRPQQGSLARSIEEEDDVRLVMVMVKSSSNAKKMVKGGLRRIAQSGRGRARVVLSRDRDTWERDSPH